MDKTGSVDEMKQPPYDARVARGGLVADALDDAHGVQDVHVGVEAGVRFEHGDGAGERADG